MSLAIGTVVKHPARPEWGPGRVQHVLGSHVWVDFRDIEERHPGEALKRLDAGRVTLEPLADPPDIWLRYRRVRIRPDGQVHPPDCLRWTPAQALRPFLAAYPGAFRDPLYQQGERARLKRLEAECAGALLGGSELRGDGTRELCHLLRRLASASRLLSKFEVSAVSAASSREAEGPMAIQALVNLVRSGEARRELWDTYVEALLRMRSPGDRLGTWPVATLFPFLASSTRFVFLKPRPVRHVADHIGFPLDYSPRLTWTCYQRMVEFYEGLLDWLRPHGASDFLDVYIFISGCATLPETPAGS